MAEGRWLSKPAVLWALDEAPGVPPELVSALVALARHAGLDGRGAHPSAATIAGQTRKSERQAKRDLKRLEELKLIMPGDTAIVAHIRADRRPKVYDLAMPRGDTDDMSSDGHGVTPRVARGDTQGRHGVSPMSPEEVLKTSRKGARGPSASPPRTPAEKIRRAPPCHKCGEAFTQDQLADPEFRVLAVAGAAGHPDCEAPAP